MGGKHEGIPAPRQRERRQSAGTYAGLPMAQRLEEVLLLGWCMAAWLREEVLRAGKKCAIA